MSQLSKKMMMSIRTRKLRMPHVALAFYCVPLLFPPEMAPVNTTYAAPMWQDTQPETMPDAMQDDVPTLAQANALLQAQEMAEAREAFAKITQADPENGNAWYQFGYCQLVMGDNAESVDSFARAIKLRTNAPAAAYNIACAYAKDNNVDKGFAWLNKSFDFGFDQFDLIASDPDLDNLRDDPRFARLPKAKLNLRSESALAVELYAADGVKIYGDLYAIDAPKSEPLILLFHQGGSNKSEYYSITPRLNEMGFHCLAIDARSGGARFGHQNETANEFEGSTGMLEAYVDLEAALKYVRSQGYTGKLTAWGSSYSSGLVLKLAKDYPDDIVATLSFSIPAPRNDFMGDTYNPDHWANASKAAMFLTLPPNEMNEARQAFFDSIHKDNKVLFVQEYGTHGSSTLHEDRNSSGSEDNWKEVVKFLKKYSN